MSAHCRSQNCATACHCLCPACVEAAVSVARYKTDNADPPNPAHVRQSGEGLERAIRIMSPSTRAHIRTQHRDDGADGETVHTLCDLADALEATITTLTAERGEARVTLAGAMQSLHKAEAERDAARAEVESLEDVITSLMARPQSETVEAQTLAKCLADAEAERDALKAENEALTRRVERARSAMLTIRQWDMLNPGTGMPESLGDAPWLRTLLDDVISFLAEVKS